MTLIKDMSKNHAQCKLRKHRSRTADRGLTSARMHNDRWCTKHKVVVGQSGWEIGWHGGTDNRQLEK